MAESVGGYKLVKVDLNSMRSLSGRLRADGDKREGRINSRVEDVRKGGVKWEDDNDARFLVYFLDRVERVLVYDEFVQDQADWLDKAIPDYESLPGDVEARIGAILSSCGL